MRDGGGKCLVCPEKTLAFVREVISKPNRISAGDEGELCDYISTGGCVGDGPKRRYT